MYGAKYISECNLIITVLCFSFLQISFSLAMRITKWRYPLWLELQFWCYSSFLWFWVFFGGKATWEGGYQGKMVIYANPNEEIRKDNNHFLQLWQSWNNVYKNFLFLFLSMDHQHSKVTLEKLLPVCRTEEHMNLSWDDAWSLELFSSNFDDKWHHGIIQKNQNIIALKNYA